MVVANIGSIFTTPWEKISASIEALAASHANLARNISMDVEVPLRDFGATNREMQAMTTVTGNLQALAREVDNANKKSEKLKEKGGKASASKVAGAASEIESAQSQWDSQAPYVFERLQEVDEIRCDKLRDLLTQYQTHVIESSSAMSSTAEECLNALLNLQSVDEIKTFALRMTSDAPRAEPRKSRAETMPLPPSTGGSIAPTSSVPQHEDGSSQRSSSSKSATNETARDGTYQLSPVQGRPERPERTKSGFGGLKRLGTVIGRRKSTHPYGQSRSPERKKSSSNLSSSGFSPFKKRSKDKQQTEAPAQPSSSSRRLSETAAPRLPEMAQPLGLDMSPSEHPNGTVPEAPEVESGLVNGAKSVAPQLQEPLQPTVASGNGAAQVNLDSRLYKLQPY